MHAHIAQITTDSGINVWEVLSRSEVGMAWEQGSSNYIHTTVNFILLQNTSSLWWVALVVGMAM